VHLFSHNISQSDSPTSLAQPSQRLAIIMILIVSLVTAIALVVENQSLSARLSQANLEADRLQQTLERNHEAAEKKARRLESSIRQTNRRD